MGKKQTGLGKGLDALFSDNEVGREEGSQMEVRISEVEPNKEQPRRTFDEASISTLADSIKEHGLLQPILVRPLEGGGYQIVAGERRWRACRMLGMSEIPVQIREISDHHAAQIALVENLLRENLNPVEEAQGYKDLVERYGMTQEEVAKSVGKSRSSVANMLRMLNLPEEVQDLLRKGRLTAGHAKALGGFGDTESMIKAAKKAADGQMSVRVLENMAAHSLSDDSDTGEAENKSEMYENSAALLIPTELESADSVSSEGESFFSSIESGLSDMEVPRPTTASGEESAHEEDLLAAMSIIDRYDSLPSVGAASDEAPAMPTARLVPPNERGQQMALNPLFPGWMEEQNEKFYKEMELSLAAHLKRKVRIEHGKTKGTLSIDFYNEQDLMELARIMAN